MLETWDNFRIGAYYESSELMCNKRVSHGLSRAIMPDFL
jgi:hypothetical protein